LGLFFAVVLFFFISGLLLHRIECAQLGVYRSREETGLLIPSR
jgi:hypothetical protein